MKKIIMVFSLVLIFTICFSACQTQNSNIVRSTKPGDTIHKSDNVEVIHVNSGKKEFVEYLYAPLSEERAFSENKIILSGTVSNVRYVQVNYTYTGFPRTDDITLFDVEVDSVFQGESQLIQENAILTMGIGYNMSNYSEGAPIVSEGKTYLIFCELPATDGSDIRERADYVDCWVRYSNYLLIEKVGDYYLANGFFADYVSGVDTIDKSFGITEEVAAQFSSMGTSAMLATAQVNSIRNTAKQNQIDISDEVLKIMKDRTRANTVGFAAFMGQNCVINCQDFENAILQVVNER